MVEQVRRCSIQSLQVTLDGCREDHDQHRYLKGKKPTYDRIVENIENACEQVTINLRVNIDRRNFSGIPALLDDLTHRSLQKHIYLYFARVDAINEMSADYESHCFPIDAYTEIENKAYCEALERGFHRGSNPLKAKKSTFCGANSRNHFVVDSNVNLLKCYTDLGMADKYGIGFIGEDGQEVIDKPHNLVKWLGWDPFEIEDCRKCKVLPVCMGGCSYKVITRGLDIEHACIQLKFGLEETLELIGERIMQKKQQIDCSALGGCNV
jgi:uncharacterized protein